MKEYSLTHNWLTGTLLGKKISYERRDYESGLGYVPKNYYERKNSGSS